MNLLALDTTTETMSVGVQRAGVAVPWVYQGAGGAQSSARLIGCVQELMAQADLRFEQLQAIVFGAGPGAFTGLRTACAVAQGLGFGAGVPLIPADSLLATAEQARAQAGFPTRWQVTVALDARMDEVYANNYQFESGQWRSNEGVGLISPENLRVPAGHVLVGNAAAVYAGRMLHTGETVAAVPTAQALLRLAPQLWAAGAAVPAQDALPVYVRDKVAQTTAERQAQSICS
jgi:tRNA threonylcarbamoyladenosine biosynthesis protein TsaB